MSPRKPTPKPTTPTMPDLAQMEATTVTQPAVPSDERFGNMIIGERDQAVVKGQTLRSQLTARNAQYERDTLRLNAEYQTDYESLSKQIAEEDRVVLAADASLEALKAASVANVVPMERGDAA